MLNEKIDELTTEEKILETLQAILYRINKLEDKLDQLNDPYNLNDYFKAKNNLYSEHTLIDSSGTY